MRDTTSWNKPVYAVMTETQIYELNAAYRLNRVDPLIYAVLMASASGLSLRQCAKRVGRAPMFAQKAVKAWKTGGLDAVLRKPRPKVVVKKHSREVMVKALKLYFEDRDEQGRKKWGTRSLSKHLLEANIGYVKRTTLRSWIHRASQRRKDAFGLVLD